MDLYQAVGGRDVCVQLSKAFYTRVWRDPVLRPLFPGKSMRCAVEAFAAFLAQFLGGPPEDAQARWELSLRESHSHLEIGRAERQTWMKNMIAALQDVPLDDSLRLALRDLFARSSAYIANDPAAPHDLTHPEMAERWTEQRALDDLVALIRHGAADRVLELAHSPALQHRFARDRAVFAHALGLMLGRNGAILDYVERELLADPKLARVPNRYGRTLLHDASAHGNLRMVELLLRLGADPNEDSPRAHTPLYCVANQCQVPGGCPIVRALVQAGANVNTPCGAKRCTPLHLAARRGNIEVAQALLDCGADPNARDAAGDTPHQRALNCRKLAVAHLLASRIV